MKSPKWETLSSELALDHPFLRVTMETIRLPNGDVISEWPLVQTGDFVSVFVVNADAEGLVLQGYRHGLGKSTWQLVGGSVEENEDSVAAIQRELLEETGYQCRRLRYLNSSVVDANRHIGTGHFFLGYGPEKVGEPNSGDLEAYEIKWVPLNELKRGLWDGSFSVLSYSANVAMALLALDT